MYSDEMNAKLQAQAYVNQAQCADAQTMGFAAGTTCATAQYRRPSPQEDAERNHLHHSEQAQKAGEAAKFLQLHPEFNRFIELVRQGAIQF